jgi:hypothetical protein
MLLNYRIVIVYWILAALCLLIALTVPRLRIPAIIGCVLLGFMLAWGMVQRWRGPEPSTSAAPPTRGSPMSPAVVLGAFPLESVKASELRLTGSGAPFQLRGRVANDSSERVLRSITVLVTRRDCYASALDPSGCEPFMQNQQWISVTVPPQQEREFAVSFWAHGSAPRPRGTLQDSFKILAATGGPVAAPVSK